MSEETQKGMPQAILNMINENSGGCYFLFYINADGTPQFVYDADNQMVHSGMVQTLAKIVNALEEVEGVQGEVFKEQFLESLGVKSFDMSDFDDLEDEDD